MKKEVAMLRKTESKGDELCNTNRRTKKKNDRKNFTGLTWWVM